MGKKAELFLLLLLIAGLLMAGTNLQKYVASDRVETEEKKVVLDAGHGGRDPGKIGVGEVQEKDINLKIAKKIREKLEERGIRAVMTREKDETLAPAGSANRQVEDIKKRVERIDGENALLAVSIHQNSYQDPKVRGAQVFYYQHSTEGKEAAAILQEALIRMDPEHPREAKANGTYYLLRRTQTPTVIVECGFLSNPEEAKLLASEEYQEKIAEAVAEGIETCLQD